MTIPPAAKMIFLPQLSFFKVSNAYATFPSAFPGCQLSPCVCQAELKFYCAGEVSGCVRVNEYGARDMT